MEKKESSLNKEICFLIAKFLQESYPELSKNFISECEKNKLFPSSVFTNSPSYDQLNTSMYPTIPSTQLTDLLMIASKSYNNPSFLRPLIYQRMPIKQANNSFKPVKRIIGHTFIVYCLSIDKTSQILITGSDDSIVKVWKLPELSLINSYIEHNDAITNIEIHPSNLYFISSSADGIVCVFSLITGVLKFKTKFPSEINDIHFSQCGKYLSISTKENGIFLWIFDDFLLKKPEHRKWSNSLINKDIWWTQFTPLSNFMFFVTATNDIYVYHISSKRTKLIFHSEKEISSLSINRKLPFKIISSIYHSSYFYVFMNSDRNSFFSKKIKIDLGEDQCIIDVKWNCDESLIIALTKNSGIYAWNARSLMLTYHVDNNNYLRNCRRLSINPVMPYIVFTSNKDYSCSFWDLSMSPIKNTNSSSPLDIIPLDNFESSDNEENEEAGDGDNNNRDDGENNNNNNISQFNFAIVKETVNAAPISTCTVYFKLECICWSPNGECIICSDNLQGFTIFLRKAGEINIQTEHQYLLKERIKYLSAQRMLERELEVDESDTTETSSGIQDQQQQTQEENINTQPILQSINDDQNILVDAELNPLIPQPKRWKLHQINLRIKKSEVSNDIKNYEATLSRIFKK